MPARIIPETTGKPYKPSYLSKEATKVWDILVDELYETGCLSEADGVSLAELCEAHAGVLTARKELKATGGPILYTKTSCKKNPWLDALNQSWSRWYKLSRQFPISPRSRIDLKSDPVPGEEDNEFFKSA